MKFYFFYILIAGILLTQCVEENDYIPKPKGYFRIDFPEKSYSLLNDNCPFTFEKPDHAVLVDKPNSDKPCFKDLHYPQLKATVYLTYLSIDSNFTEIAKFTDDKVYEHHTMASGIKVTPFHFQEKNVSGATYSLMGDVAVNYLFFITDSTQNYFAGQLYFESVPNYDSLQPCIDFITADLEHIIETFSWK